MRKNLLLKLGLSGLLVGSMGALLLANMAVGALGASSTTHTAEAAALTTCAVGTPCASGTVGIGITPGTLSGSVNSPLVNSGSPITDTGTDQDIPFAFQSSVTNATGTSAGWHEAVSATPITYSDGSTSDLFLALSSSDVVSCLQPSSCKSPSTLTLATDGTDLVPGPVTTVGTNVGNTGLGSYSIHTYGYFLYPAFAGSGATSGGAITVTINTGP